MRRKLFLGPMLGAVCLILVTANAWAVNCSPNPFTLTEGTTGFATQVMANFNNLLTCANTVLGKFTGPGSSVSGNAVTFSGTSGQLGQDSGVALNNLGWTAYTPTITCSIGAGTETFSPGGKFKVIGKTVFFTATNGITSNGTCSGVTTVTLPVVNAGSGLYAITAISQTNQIAGICGITPGNFFMTCTKYDGTYLGANGVTIAYSGSYEIN